MIIVIIAFILIKKKQTSLKGLYEQNFDDSVVIINENGKEKEIKVSFSGWFNPYNKEGKTNLIKLTRHQYGVYLIKSKRTNEIVYIGHSSSNLYKALYRHFQYYNDENSQNRTYYGNKQGYEVAVILTSKKQAPKVEISLIKEYKPRDAFLKYENYEIEFVESPEIEDFEEWQITEVPF
ncbi:MAG: GIY-YIG nuclease family protein [Bacteroidales bacterium]|nr:GIY-YIG nuclease family protein [Bacteroidales bacterium]